MILMILLCLLPVIWSIYDEITDDGSQDPLN